jgi:c-di-GMP-binding flagellar brake protein YcgR
MLTIIKKILGLRKADDSIERQKTIYNLHRLQQNHCFIDVRFPARGNQHFQSMILDINPEKNCVTIDELYPKGEAGIVSAGEAVEISCRSKGLNLRFISHIEQVNSEDDAPSYDIELPGTIQQQQNRNNFRVTMPDDAGVKLYLALNTEIMCSVLNLSASGIGFYIAGNYTGELEKQGQLDNCVLELPDLTTLRCNIDIRSIEFKNRPNPRTIVGARISDMQIPEQKKLEQFLASIQRQQRQQALR